MLNPYNSNFINRFDYDPYDPDSQYNKLNFTSGNQPTINPLKPQSMWNNPFGVNDTTPPQSGINSLQPAPAPTPSDPTQAFDFPGEYAKLDKDRPKRLAYQQAVEQGPEEIKRGKWAMLGAAITAAGANLGGESPTNASKLALSAYYRPQTKADEDWKEKTAGLANLANMEDTDKTNSMRALELRYNDYYKRKESLRQDAAEARAGRAEDRDIELQKIQIKNIQNEMDVRNTDKYTDDDGVTWLRDRSTGKVTRVGKTGPSRMDRIIEGAATKAGESQATLPADLAKIKAQNQGKLDVVNARDAAAANRLREKLQQSGLKGGATEEYRRMVVNMDKALIEDPSLNAYVKQNADGSFGIKDESDFPIWNQMDEEDRAKMNKLRAAVLAGPSNTPANNTTGGGNTNTAAPGNTDINRAPRNSDGTITIVAPTGEELNIDPKDPRVPEMLSPSKGGRIKGADEAAPKPNIAASSFSFGSRPADASTSVPPVTQPVMPPVNQPVPSAGIPRDNKLIPQNSFGLGINPSVVAPPIRTPTPPPTQPSNIPPALSAGNVGANIPNNPITLNRPPVLPPRVNAPGPVQAPINPAALNPALPAQRPNIPVSGPMPNANPIRLASSPVNTPSPVATVIPTNNAVPVGAAPPVNPIRISPPPVAKAPVPGNIEFNSKFTSVRDEVLKKLGVDIKVTRGKTTAKEQAAIKTQADKEGVWRTNADGTNVISPHQVSEAADVMFIDPKTGKTIPGVLDSKGRPTPMGQKLYDGFGQIAEDNGLTWGGRWKERDWGHVQLRPVLPK